MKKSLKRLLASALVLSMSLNMLLLDAHAESIDDTEQQVEAACDVETLQGPEEIAEEAATPEEVIVTEEKEPEAAVKPEKEPEKAVQKKVEFQEEYGQTQEALTVNASSYSGTYDGYGHTISVNVSGVFAPTIYYSTSTKLTSSNYNTKGFTQKAYRTVSGKTTVYFYVKDRFSANGYASSKTISIKPKVTIDEYVGVYDEKAHKSTVKVEGDAKIYYSKTKELTYKNYKEYGSTKMPSRTSLGTSKIYYIAIPENQPTEATSVKGSFKITVIKEIKNIKVTAADYSGTYNGKEHSATLDISGPSKYTVYYSTSRVLDETNYSRYGSTTKPVRTTSGVTDVYYYIKDNTKKYYDYAGSNRICVYPKVTVKDTTYMYDGRLHQPSVTVEGGAYIYYSTTTPLDKDNYRTGSRSIPRIAEMGTTKIYYYAYPTSGNHDAGKAGSISFLITDKVITASNLAKIYSSKDQTLSLGVRVTGDAKLTYKSDNAKVTVKDGKATIKAKFLGKATITITAAATATQKKTTKKITITTFKNTDFEYPELVNNHIKIKWKKATNASGYEMQIATDEEFTKDLITKSFSKDKTSVVLDEISYNKTYYIRIRSYCTASGTKKYGAWKSTHFELAY